MSLGPGMRPLFIDFLSNPSNANRHYRWSVSVLLELQDDRLPDDLEAADVVSVEETPALFVPLVLLNSSNQVSINKPWATGNYFR